MTSLNMAPFSSLRRQHAIHAASGKQQPSKPRTSTLRIRRLSVLPEEDESSASASCSSSPSSSPSPTPTKAKRLSKYGKASVLSRQPSGQDLTFERPRPAPRPPAAAAAPSSSSRRQTVRLSSFEFDLSASLAKKERRLSRIPEGSDMVAHAIPASPTLSCASDVDVSLDGPDSVRLSTFAFDVPTDFSLNSDDRHQPPPRAASPASSLSSAYTSFSTSSSSSDLPLTPTSSDEDWPASPSPSAKSPVLTPAPAVPIRPLVIHKTKARSPAAAAATIKVAHDEHEDDATWYARELSARFALLTPPAFLNSFPRPDSAAPTQPSPRTPSSSSASRSRYSKPLPAIPPPPSSSSPTRGPSPQLDPTYTHARPALPLSAPPARLRRRVSLTIKVPPVARPPPSSPIPCDVDVGEIFDDGDAWAPFDFEHGRPASGALSPPRLPESPASACLYSFAYESERERRMPVIDSASSSSASSPTVPVSAFEGPVPAIVVSALEPAAGAVPATVPVLAQTPTFVDEKEVEVVEGEEEPSPLLRSRWSSSTLSSLVDSSHSPISSALSPKTLSFHIGNVARRVVVRTTAKRASAGSPSKAVAQSAVVENASGGTGLRRRMSEASVGSCESGESGASTGSSGGGGLRRKAIPVELFMRGM